MKCKPYSGGPALGRINWKLTISALCLLLVAALPASAHTVTFKYTCTNCKPTLQLATLVGQVASDSNMIATVQSDVPGYTNPVPISGGLLTVESSPATFVDCSMGDYCGAEFKVRGGSASVVGSVFGLSSGSTLLTAYFEAGAGDVYLIEAHEGFDGATIVLYVNPAILANLGLDGLPNVGIGQVQEDWEWNLKNDDYDGTVTVTFTPAGPAAE